MQIFPAQEKGAIKVLVPIYKSQMTREHLQSRKYHEFIKPSAVMINTKLIHYGKSWHTTNLTKTTKRTFKVYWFLCTTCIPVLF